MDREAWLSGRVRPPLPGSRALAGISSSRSSHNTGFPEMDIEVNCDSLLHGFRLMSFWRQACTGKSTLDRRDFFVPTSDYQTIFTPETKKGLAISRKVLDFSGSPGRTPFASLRASSPAGSAPTSSPCANPLSVFPALRRRAGPGEIPSRAMSLCAVSSYGRDRWLCGCRVGRFCRRYKRTT
jgi:hypothetical protein